ncbi:alpha/beta hydrolase [Marinibactrum halimedae]|uniref:Alpha/beta hydrolase n=1 Tax=Marinibactrum halimedae TaxID=1444977 RepID=A0AA37WKX9_9GAMM|nr:alpha/beta hydrolase [Marinibactrum halimedae]MCD9459939.1 alpha/beta hydrolase [Marinibactrum halimedae]GLS25204.1 hypothetical protein GCM10007877_09180 [Marinibactrum halimedae]
MTLSVILHFFSTFLRCLKTFVSALTSVLAAIQVVTSQKFALQKVVLQKATVIHWLWKGLLVSICISSPFVNANTGVAFVHGTGDSSDALNDYWTRDMVFSVTGGLPDTSKFVVVNCNFDEYAWSNEAGGCLARQISSFIERESISDLVVITHSYGGTVMRWILSNPTWDRRHPVIINATRSVTAIAPSSLGTPLADAVIDGNRFERVLGWILGYRSPAVELQQEDWMAHYNNTLFYGTAGRPALPVTFKSIVGTDVESSPFDSDSYCGGYAYQVALEVTQEWLDNCSDGFIECRSQAGAGTVWFYDVDRTRRREPLSHHQSRRPCFNLDVFLRNDL